MGLPRNQALDHAGKALRKAVIDDWCARNGVSTIPAVYRQLTDDELAAIATSRVSWLGRSGSIKTEIRAGAKPPPCNGTPA